MPTATLQNPRSLSIGGKRFEQHVATPVSAEFVAEHLNGNPRFVINGLDGATLSMAKGGRPHVRVERMEAIRTADSMLDVDDENSYIDVAGFGQVPNPQALMMIMGWLPTEQEVNEALKLNRKVVTNRAGETSDLAGIRDAAATRAPRAPVLTVNDHSARILDPDSEAAQQIEDQQEASRKAQEGQGDNAAPPASGDTDKPVGDAPSPAERRTKISAALAAKLAAKKEVDPTTAGAKTVE